MTVHEPGQRPRIDIILVRGIERLGTKLVIERRGSSRKIRHGMKEARSTVSNSSMRQATTVRSTSEDKSLKSVVHFLVGRRTEADRPQQRIPRHLRSILPGQRGHRAGHDHLLGKVAGIGECLLELRLTMKRREHTLHVYRVSSLLTRPDSLTIPTSKTRSVNGERIEDKARRSIGIHRAHDTPPVIRRSISLIICSCKYKPTESSVPIPFGNAEIASHTG